MGKSHISIIILISNLQDKICHSHISKYVCTPLCLIPKNEGPGLPTYLVQKFNFSMLIFKYKSRLHRSDLCLSCNFYDIASVMKCTCGTHKPYTLADYHITVNAQCCLGILHVTKQIVLGHCLPSRFVTSSQNNNRHEILASAHKETQRF